MPKSINSLARRRRLQKKSWEEETNIFYSCSRHHRSWNLESNRASLIWRRLSIKGISFNQQCAVVCGNVNCDSSCRFLSISRTLMAFFVYIFAIHKMSREKYFKTTLIAIISLHTIFLSVNICTAFFSLLSCCLSCDDAKLRWATSSRRGESHTFFLCCASFIHLIIFALVY